MEEPSELKRVVFEQMRGPVERALDVLAKGRDGFILGELLSYLCENVDPDVLDRWTVNANACCLSCLLTEFVEANHPELASDEAYAPTAGDSPPGWPSSDSSPSGWSSSGWSPPGWPASQPPS